MSEQKESVRTIKEANALIRSLIETDITIGKYFWIGGEITRYYVSHLNHAYFTLEDNGFSISCMMPNQYMGETNFPLNKGMMVDLYGTLQVYEKRGEVQIVVEKARLVDKYKAQYDPNILQQLKENRLFPRTKRDIPSVNKIVLITSKNSAALEDFRDMFYKEGGKARIEVLDVLVQGELAPPLIVDAIQRANQQQLGDVIVLARGGGRNAELKTFNDYRIVEAICLSRIPVVTGIGHQQDDTIADLVADKSTNTPTDAAVELAKLSQFSETLPTVVAHQIERPVIRQAPQYAYKSNVKRSGETIIPIWVYAAIGTIGVGVAAMILIAMLILQS
jgi:exodeoxyribonuclease VII large subunit